MKFFKCLSQNVSVVYEEVKTRYRSGLLFKNKKRRSIVNENHHQISKKGQFVRFALPENETVSSSDNSEVLMDTMETEQTESRDRKNSADRAQSERGSSTSDLDFMPKIPRTDDSQLYCEINPSFDAGLLDELPSMVIQEMVSDDEDTLAVDDSRLGPYNFDITDNASSYVNVTSDITINNSTYGTNTFSFVNATSDSTINSTYGTTTSSILNVTSDSTINNSTYGTINPIGSSTLITSRGCSTTTRTRPQSTKDKYRFHTEEKHRRNLQHTQKQLDDTTFCREESLVNGPTKHKRIMITVMRGKNGFGCTFVGECPPRVGRLEKGSPAEKAGIKIDDLIILINGQKVSRTSADKAALYVTKTNPKFLMLEIRRPCIKITKVISTDCQHGHHQISNEIQEVYDNTTYDSIMEDTRVVTGADHETIPVFQQNKATTVSKPLVEPANMMTAKTANNTCVDLTSSLLHKHESVHHLMSLEQEFFDYMNYGIERYSRPLRHCVLSGHQHTTLFQNIEKLVIISQHHFKEVQNMIASISSDNDDSLSTKNSMVLYLPALVYELKIDTLCQAYEVYAHGLHQANDMLREISKDRAFANFTRDHGCGGSGHPSISDFINRPVLHLQELHKAMNKILTVTLVNSPDAVNLQQIVEKLAKCVKTVTEHYTPIGLQVQEHTTSRQFHPVFYRTNTSDKNKMASSMNSQSNGSTMSSDKDGIPIQDRIVFSPSLQNFQLNQDVIYQGNIYKCEKKGSWFKYRLLIFSDLLLLASERSDGSLYVKERPISIQHLAGLEINRQHSSEFVLHHQATFTEAVSQIQKPSSSATTITLRAESSLEKFMWKSLFEQRVLSVTGVALEHIDSVLII